MVDPHLQALTKLHTDHVHHVRGLVANGALSDHSIVIAELDLTVMALELIA